MTTKTARFTASRVSTLAAGDHTDPSTAGLQLRVRTGTAKDSRTWMFRYKWRGRPLRIAIGHLPTMGLADAREKAQRLRRGIDDGIDPRRAESRRRPAEEPPAITSAGGSVHSIENLANEFMSGFVNKRHKDPSYVRLILDTHVLPEWAGRDARTIKKREVIELTDKIANGVPGERRPAPVMANRVAAQIARMFAYGEERAILEEGPGKRLFQPGGPEKSRDRALSDMELTALLGCVDDVMRSTRMARAIRILLGTAQRVGELALARWTDIDFEAKTWTIPKEVAKNGIEHAVPLSDYVLNEFTRLKAGAALRARFVFPTEDGSAPGGPKLITRVVARNQKTFKQKGIAKFTPHDLRRTARTCMAALGIDEHIAERVLNHKIPGMAGVYNRHRYAPEVRAALEKWGAHLQGLTP